jgi:hypothetical protein
VRKLVAVVSLVVALAPAGARSAPTTALKGSFGPRFLVTLASDGTASHLHVDGSGTATPIGATRIVADGLLSYFDPTPCESFSNLHITLQGARGDSITMAAQGRQCYRVGTGTGDAGAVFIDGFGTFRVTGGSGAFAGAVGQGKLILHGQIDDVLLGGYAGGYSPLTLDGVVGVPA